MRTMVTAHALCGLPHRRRFAAMFQCEEQSARFDLLATPDMQILQATGGGG